MLLPAAAHVEDEGTFVNLDGITQRFRRAYPARAESAAALDVGGGSWRSELGLPLGCRPARATCSASGARG